MLHSFNTFDYIKAHPKEFKEEPLWGICGTMWLRMREEGRPTPEDSDNRINLLISDKQIACPCQTVGLQEESKVAVLLK